MPEKPEPRHDDQWTLLQRIETTFRRRVAVIARDLVDRAPESHQPEPPRPDLCLRELSADDAAAYSAFRPGQGADTLRQRLRQGARCFAVVDRGEIVHTGWSTLARAHVPYLDRDLLLEADDVYLFDVYTRPGARLGDVGSMRAEHDRRFYAALGCRRSIAIVAIENTGSLRYVMALGFRRIGYYGYWKLGPLSRWRTEVLGAEQVPRLIDPER